MGDDCFELVQMLFFYGIEDNFLLCNTGIIDYYFE